MLEERLLESKRLKELLDGVPHQVRGVVKFSWEVMKHDYDVRRGHANSKEGDQVWLYNPRRKKRQSQKIQSPWESPYTAVEHLCDVTYRM